MGCFWSSEASRDRCIHCGQRAANNLRIVDHVCEVCLSRATRRGEIRSYAASAISSNARPTPMYGEYKCICGRFWNSRLSWPGRYEACKRCKRHVYAHSQRPLRKSDMTGVKENVVEHPKELCQMCQQLGYYCGAFRTKSEKPNTRTNHRRKW